MGTVVSSGQITIVDSNDAKSIVGSITNGAQPLQQIMSKNNGVYTHNPSRSVSNLVLTPKIYAGSTVDISANLTNPKWSLTPGGAALVTGSGLTVVATTGSTPSLTISDNSQVTLASPNKTIYFEGDYMDLSTGLTTHLIYQTTISLVQTGDSAVYVQFAGSNIIEKATGTTKQPIEVRAELVRNSGLDTDNLSYRWSKIVGGVWTAINTSLANYATMFGFRTTVQADADNLMAATSAMVGVGVPASAAWTANTANNCKAIVIDETGVDSLGLFKVEIYDTVELKSYAGYFTVKDVSDPYQVSLVSTSGEKLSNGSGTSNIYPLVYSGGSKVTNLTGWNFNWQFWSQDLSTPSAPLCYRTGFVDQGKTAQVGGRALGATPNTAGIGSVITYGGAAFTTVVAGDIAKILMANGKTRYYEIASVAGNTVTIRQTAITNTWLNASTPFITVPTLNEFANGVLFICVGTRTTAGANNNDTAAQITINGEDVDVKGVIMCDAVNPN